MSPVFVNPAPGPSSKQQRRERQKLVAEREDTSRNLETNPRGCSTKSSEHDFNNSPDVQATSDRLNMIMNAKSKPSSTLHACATPPVKRSTLSPISVDTDDDADRPEASLSSPGSASSEPAYERQPGFRFHAQHRKHVKTTLARRGDLELAGGKGPGATTRPRVSARKEPLPMKLRALPQSFWQQPNDTNVLSPGEVYPTSPPLAIIGKLEPLPGVSTTSTATSEAPGKHLRVTSSADTDLLFSLFRGVEADMDVQGTRVTVVKRGRPRKSPGSLSVTRVPRDQDPYLASNETLLPLLSDRPGARRGGCKGRQVLAMVSLKDGDKTLSLPTLQVQRNYSQILSDLVVNL